MVLYASSSGPEVLVMAFTHQCMHKGVSSIVLEVALAVKPLFDALSALPLAVESESYERRRGKCARLLVSRGWGGGGYVIMPLPSLPILMWAI